MKKRTSERLKSLLIILLACSSVFLASKTGLFDDFFNSIPVLSVIGSGAGDKDGGETREPSYSEACRPLTIAITWETSLRYGVKYDDKLLSGLYDRFGNILGETLGSASEPISASETEWKQALGSAGLYFDFGCEVPLSALARWLGTEMMYDSGAFAGRICICADDGDGLMLMYLDGDSSAWRCSTASAFSSIRSKLEEYSQNDASFAFELGDSYPELEPYTLLIPGTRETPDITADTPQFASGLTDAVLTAFRLSSYVNSSYPEADGTLVYVEDGKTVRISGSGLIVYKDTMSSDTDYAVAYSGSSPGAADLIEAARSIVAQIAAGAGGSQSLYFTGIASAGEDSYEVTFDYFISGAKIMQADGNAAVVSISGGTVTDVRMTVRTYAVSETATALLPELLAAAAVPGGRDLLLVYSDSGGSALSPLWIAG